MAECNGLDKSFVEHHKQQLQSSGVPPHFWPTIFRKLIAQVTSLLRYWRKNIEEGCRLSFRVHLLKRWVVNFYIDKIAEYFNSWSGLRTMSCKYFLLYYFDDLHWFFARVSCSSVLCHLSVTILVVLCMIKYSPQKCSTRNSRMTYNTLMIHTDPWTR